MRTVILIVLGGLYSCGKESNVGEVSYNLETVASSEPGNRLFLTSSKGSPPFFKITGNGLTASVDLDSIYPLRDVVDLMTTGEGEYELELVLLNQDYHAYLEDSLFWEFSTEPPPDPVVSFNENATHDTDVILLIPSTKGEDTNQIWIAGDLNQFSAGQWYDIPLDGQIPLVVSSEDGIKKFQVRYKNIFGLESDLVDLELVKKSTPPLDCQANTKSNIVNESQVEIAVSAIDPYPLQFQITGDVRTIYDYQTFSEGVRAYRQLKNLNGYNDIQVTIADIAGNQCEPINLKIYNDPQHSEFQVSFKQHTFYTFDPRVIVQARVDSLEDVTMKIVGDVMDTDSTFTTMPFSPETEVVLSPSQGTRIVEIIYYLEGQEFGRASGHIYLLPEPSLQGIDPNFIIVPNKIIELSSISVTGCAEMISQVSFAETLVCTRVDSQIKVSYLLSNGEILEHSFEF
ncbi:hypothetical protein [Pseudobacteriovorax antillogorgiicola]|uniref:Uncharacterized protein n=1 Tax=Pseudobacteriovorax antillogorgiicola TaxID=1513793 RepID=A0A1Y6BMM6_9BACT|nr:hypothetical protein [Pseudobacteriovorax antillogorgiicola]TCS54557.1 hypothetical protein EDD56_10670 [Pseudobacteriovorax antillogorgiicola]SMF18395.1 hypothetical protein SAMN06296036_106173 [Pseudobacteriovorax antillogorgiicola]